MRKKGFTLIELLVVIAVISILMSMLVPALARTKQQSKGLVCLSNLRQMSLAAIVYTQNYEGFYPMAYYYCDTADGQISYCWDFTTVNDSGSVTIEPGLLWQGDIVEKIQQCPSFNGASNTEFDPYTGYNYNTSYIGHGQYEYVPAPAKTGQVKKPFDCAIFGDGQWEGGGNKFMRSPLPGPGDLLFSGRYAGTQGYRHNQRTNVAWCDGHTSTIKQLNNGIFPEEHADLIAPETGFLSEDNSAYDLD